MTWLRDHELESVNTNLDEGYAGEPQWIIDHARDEKKKAFLATKKELEAHLVKVRAREARQRKQYESGEPPRKRKKIDSGGSTEQDQEAQFMLDDYDSDTGQDHGTDKSLDASSGLSATTLELMNKLGMISDKNTDEALEMPDGTKVFYCSRTHSQLMQFAHEVRRVRLPAAQDDDNGDHEAERVIEDIKHLSLGSRKNLCINSDVKKLGGSTAINERCLELQQQKTPKENRCQFLPNKENETLLHSFRDHTLAKVRDIEDLAVLGKSIGICPYYASRATVKPSEIVTVPYPLMLQRSAREALEISLRDHVVIIDEAHNLMDAISNIYSSTVTLNQLQRARGQLGVYLQKFRNKLKGKNRVYVTQVVRLIDSLSSFLATSCSQGKPVEGIVNVADLMAGKGADQINLYKLSQYLKESRLARKVDGYISFQDAATSNSVQEKTMPVLTHIEGFFSALNNPAAEGRFFYSKLESGDAILKYQLLDPTYHFKDVVESARAVILAGGTMSPMDDYTKHLFPYLDPERITTLSCGHVIPAENLIAWPVSKAFGNVELDFTFAKRNQPALLSALGESLTQLAQVVPDGMVIFFPSYAYLEQVTNHWKSGSGTTWASLSDCKPVFFENKEATGTDDVLKSYSDSIANGKGGMLLSVVGGKMSEGINFSDSLGRAVVIVGLPFPNVHSAEWKAKMEYIEQQSVARGGSRAEGKEAAREFYENACMRAVNQSIGRAIRHRGDYAGIYMLDRRYGTARIQGKLPAWIKKGLVGEAAMKPYSEVVRHTREFFGRKRGS
jgi:chromosome transmission fidelity protein 1